VVRTLGWENPKLYRELMTRWQRALSEADVWLTELSTGSARQRVARLLPRLAHNRVNSRCELFCREDVGTMLEITTETTSHTIAEYKPPGPVGGSGPQFFPARPPVCAGLPRIDGEPCRGSGQTHGD